MNSILLPVWALAYAVAAVVGSRALRKFAAMPRKTERQRIDRAVYGSKAQALNMFVNGIGLASGTAIVITERPVIGWATICCSFLCSAAAWWTILALEREAEESLDSVEEENRSLSDALLADDEMRDRLQAGIDATLETAHA